MRFSLLLSIMAFGVGYPVAAPAFVRADAAGRAKIGAVHVLLDEQPSSTVMTVQAEVAGKAGQTTLVFLLPPGGQLISKPSTDTFEDVFRRTLPRLVEVPAVEPCPAGTTMNPGPGTTWIAPPSKKSHRGRWVPRQMTVEQADGLKKKKKLRLSKETLDAARKLVGPEGTLVVLTGRLGRVRRTWVPPVQVRLDRTPSTLEAGFGADQAPAGRTQRVTIITRSDRRLLRLKGPVSRLPPVGVFPEVSLETPIDLHQAVRHHAAKREGERTLVIEFEGQVRRSPQTVSTLGRYYFEQTARTARSALSLDRTRVTNPTEPRWTFRRVWRKPLSCPYPQFALHVQQQQRTELKTYAAATGRRLAEITAQTVELGYGLRADGTVTPVEPRRAPELQRLETEAP